MINNTTLQDMGQMLTRNSFRQPTLTQMEFVQPRDPPKARDIPSGWQRTVDQTTGDPMYVNASSGSVVFKYNDMFRRLKKPPRQSHQAVTPTDRSIRSVDDNIIPDEAVSSLRYSTPPKMAASSKYLDGTLAKPINLDDDEVSMGSQALSDLTNSQLPKKKKRRRVFTHSMTPGAVIGEEYYETDDDEDVTVLSPNLLAD
jgi:hypothetical protein